MLWRDIKLAQRVPDERIAAAVAEAFGVDVTRVRVFDWNHWPDTGTDTAGNVLVVHSLFRGDVAQYLHIYPQFDVAPHDELAALKRLARLLDVACLVNEHIPHPYDLRVWPDGHCDWVYLDNPITDDDDDAGGSPEELVIFSVHGAPGLARRPREAISKWRQFAVARSVPDDELRQAVAGLFSRPSADVAVVGQVEELLKVPSAPHADADFAVLRWPLRGEFPLWVEVLPYQHDPYTEDDDLEAVRKLARALGAPCLVTDDIPDPLHWFRVWGDGRLDRVELDAAALDRDAFVIVRAEPAVWQLEATDGHDFIYLERRIPDERLAAAFAATFGVGVESVRVYRPAEVLAMVADTGPEVQVSRFPERGDLALSLYVQRRIASPAHDRLALVKRLAPLLETACVTVVRLVLGERSGAVWLRAWPDGRVERVEFVETRGKGAPLTIAEVLIPPAFQHFS